ncbi:hypothetical protein C2S52_003785 [Perilla frutescens var. hirtella]|nr:hypothetical protein C2S52_003785 [Perilla frutescens var. hirtella]
MKLGAFGGGYPHEPIVVNVNGSNLQPKLPPAEVNPKEPIVPESSRCNQMNNDGDIENFADKFIKMAKLLASTMVDMIAIVEGAPNHLIQSYHFKKIVDACHQLLGHINGSSSSSQTPWQTQFIETEADDDFWADAERVTVIAEIEMAMAKRNDFLKKADDVPSFSLGLTQEIWDGVDKVVRDINFMSRDDDDEDETCLRDQGNGSMDMFGKLNFEGDSVVDQYVGKNKKVVIAGTHHMERREKGTMKKTAMFKSPFIQRVINIAAKLSNVEKTLWFWIFHYNDANPGEVVFASGAFQIKRLEMMTMTGRVEINNNILDVWSIVLNHKELSRAPESPCRFFASTKPSCFSIDEEFGTWFSPEKVELFNQCMDEEIERTKGIKISDIDLVNVANIYAF